MQIQQTRHLNQMMAHSLRHWPNIGPTAGAHVGLYNYQNKNNCLFW